MDYGRFRAPVSLARLSRRAGGLPLALIVSFLIAGTVRAGQPGPRPGRGQAQPSRSAGIDEATTPGWSPVRSGRWLTVRRARLSRWRAKCFGLCEVDTIDYLTHPAHTIRVTARGWRPRHPAHLTPGASHPPATGVGSQLAAIPAQAPIAFLLASAHFVFSTLRIRPYHLIRGKPRLHIPGVTTALLACFPRRCDTAATAAPR